MAAHTSTSLIEREVVARCIEEMAQFGPHPLAGMQRLVYTPSWDAACDRYMSWLKAEGLEVRRDAVGNIFGVLRGHEGGPCIMTGSHIDTALQGGRYDGTLGAIAGYLALRTLKQHLGQPRVSLECVAICDEEASRFHSNFWGSRAMAGLIQDGEAESIFDAEGISLADAMRSSGFDPADIPTARRDDIGAFIELHIEQGPVLERQHTAIGVVSAITAIEQKQCVVHGRADHAGGCPMDARKDAMVATAEMILAVTNLALEMGPPGVATVGRVNVRPASPNIVAAEVDFTIDMRHPDPTTHDRFSQLMSSACQEIAARRAVQFEETRILYQPATQCSPEILDVIKGAASDLGINFREMTSGAGHDTQVLARAGVRRAMIFVPSRDGRSHSPDEFTELDDIIKGISTLTETLYRLAY